ncbi:hypothetical protein CDES_02135 [Corynebacterium deserti GIMN1.010]|uniref:DUF559 domain-containing protein n=1 Tax=Corynebacterium deserti GIMN1.010 TaxID=931089 RepID=A0A0M3Q914_9CORY|nr:hypothetical protein [Corynebacterium deserti]ALC04889.1 hypothetical protein CDES_02135 [Corynebacterium deserti GIMN1.010]
MSRYVFGRTHTQIVGFIYLENRYADDPVLIGRALLKRFPEGVLRGFSALREMGYQLFTEEWEPLVFVPRNSSNLKICKGRVLRRKLPEFRVVNGRRVVGEAQALLDEFPGMAFEEQVALVDFLTRQNAGLYSELVQVNGLQDVMRYVNPMAESRPESLLRVRLIKSGVYGFEPQIPVECDSGTRFIDLANARLRVGLEYQGAVHFDSLERRAKDSQRVNELRTAGWVIIEVTWTDLRDEVRWQDLLKRLGKVVRRAEEHRRKRML